MLLLVKTAQTYCEVSFERDLGAIHEHQLGWVNLGSCATTAE